MKDIKTLLEAVKLDPSEGNIKEYTEAIQHLLEHNPTEYMSNLAYIISSTTGFETWNEFTQKHGFSNGHTKYIAETFRTVSRKMNINGHQDMYEEYTAIAEAYENPSDIGPAQKLLYEEHTDHLQKYLSSYYNRKDRSVDQLISEFGIVAIGDMISDEKKTLELLEFSKSNELFSTPLFCQYVLECVVDNWSSRLCHASVMGKKLEEVAAVSLKSATGAIVEYDESVFRESALIGDDPVYVYEEHELQSLQTMIAFNEALMAFVDDESRIRRLSEANDKYYDVLVDFGVNEHGDIVDDIDESSAAMSADMLAGGSATGAVLEKPGVKQGGPRGYIKRNHDTSWGEDDTPKADNPKDDPDPSDDDDNESDLDSFKRSPATDTPLDAPASDDSETSGPPASSSVVDTPTAPATPSTINYYYNYVNSYNKNRTDASTNKRINSDNVQNRTDSSRGKRINSDDIQRFRDEKSDFTEMFKLKGFTESDEPEKPKSDAPIRDALMDVDRALLKKQQSAKRFVRKAGQTGRAFAKPFVRTANWVSNLGKEWRALRDDQLKEKMANPHDRSKLFAALKTAIVAGSLFKVNMILAPIYLFLSLGKKFLPGTKEHRLRNQVIAELRSEVDILKTKIEDAGYKGDNAAKYKMMRIKTELEKKLIRMELGPQAAKAI